MHDNHVNLGEVYRLLQSLKEEHGEKLSSIDERLRLVNGNIAKHAERLNGHDREVRELRRRPEIEKPIPSELRELLDAARDAKGALRITRWLWAIGAAVLPLILWWLSMQRGAP